MPTFEVRTAQRTYPGVVERGVLQDVAKYIPANAARIFVVTTEDVWRHHGPSLWGTMGSRSPELLFLPQGEVNKRLAQVELLADQMIQRGADRTSLIIGF